jgi:RNA polymerase sigma factor, sigma-70 family/RNA polymerase sigma factor, TIGR02999 family
MAETPGDLTVLLRRLKEGDQAAESQFAGQVYDELRRLAANYMRRERNDHTLQPTALVHEAFLKLFECRDIDWQGRAHFFAVASQMMRRILVDHARRAHAGKRGGDWNQEPLDAAFLYAETRPVELIALDEALQRLSEIDSRQCRIVELRFFGGLSVEEAAEVLGVSERTIKREWSVARAWLYGELSKDR